MLTTILPAAIKSALYHTITTATGLYSKKLLFILHLYFLLTTVWGWKYLFFPFKSIRKGPIWMVIAKYRNCVFSKGMELIDTICAWHGIRAANKSICTQFQSHPSFSCKILIGGHVKDFPLHEQIKICKLIESLFLFQIWRTLLVAVWNAQNRIFCNVIAGEVLCLRGSRWFRCDRGPIRRTWADVNQDWSKVYLDWNILGSGNDKRKLQKKYKNIWPGT